jgi:glutamine synthetase
MLFDVYTAVNVNIPVYWDVQPHRLVKRQAIYVSDKHVTFHSEVEAEFFLLNQQSECPNRTT